MCKKTSIFLITICLLTGVLYGCGKSSTKVQNQNTQAKTEESKKEETKKEEPKKEEPLKLENETFVIYKANVDTYKKEVSQEINIPKDKSLQDKLVAIGQKLSEVEFNKLPIEIGKIQEINGKKIVKVNLKEDSNNEKGWAKSYMQGSAGGSVTSISLAETFLQKEYKGEWIDGVEFLYNGNKCEFEHAPDLADIIYRK